MTITDQITGGILPNSGMVTVSQIKKALNFYGLMLTVDDAISADVTSNINVQWRNGITFRTNDDLYSFVKTTLGYSDAQMATLMNYASSQTS